MSTHLGPSSEQGPLAIVPVRPAGPETARVSSTPAGLLRRTLGFRSPPSRRTLGYRVPSRRTLGGRSYPSRRTLGRKLPPSRRALG